MSPIVFGCKSCQRLSYVQTRRQVQRCLFELDLSSANAILAYDPCRARKRGFFPRGPGCQPGTADDKCPAPGSRRARRVWATKKRLAQPTAVIKRVA